MSRTRINILIVMGIIILYAISGCITFGSTRDMKTSLFDDEMLYLRDNATSDYINNIGNNNSDTSDTPYDIACDISGNYMDLPHSVTIYESQSKKLLAESSSHINSPAIDEYIPMEQYLTDDIKAELINTFGYTGTYSISKLEYSRDKSGQITPISITVSDHRGGNPKDMTIKCADGEPNDTIIDKQGLTELNVLAGDANAHEKKQYQTAHDITNDVDLITSYLPDDSYDTDFAASSNDGTEIKSFVLPDGTACFAVVNIQFDANYITLRSDEFRQQMMTLGAMYLVAGIIILAVANRLYTRTKQLAESKHAFTSAAAHELKTPITIINNQCECIMNDVSPDKLDEYVSTVYKQNRHMSRLVTSLLQYNRLDSQYKPDIEHINLGLLTAAELEKYDALIESGDIKIEKSIDDKAMLDADAKLMSLVIDNFLSNAVKHTPAGGKISINVQSRHSGVMLSVHNQGEQIADGTKLWEVFNRHDGSDDGSTGMGLAICKKILVMHKLTYGYRNTDDGVEFYFKTK